MTRIVQIAALLTAGSLLSTASPGQKRQDQLRLVADLVVVDATVTDKNGHYIRGLKSDEFVVYEDGVAQKIEFFDANEELALTRPLAAVFALDLSGSIQPEELVKQRVAAESFIKLMRPGSVFAVLTFNYEVKVLQDFTGDAGKISQAFRKATQAGGSTRLFASVDRALAMLKRGPRFHEGRRIRRVVIVISDGIPTEPVDQLDLIQRANDAEVTVYSITLPSYGYGQLSGQRILTLLDVSGLVPMTGGKDFSADAGDFSPALRAIAEELRYSYTLAYYPPEKSRRDGRTHQIRVESTRPGAIVRVSRQAYRSPE